VQEELSLAQTAVEGDMADGAAIAQVVARSRLEEEQAHRRALRSIVTNVQLKDIASAQVRALVCSWKGTCVGFTCAHPTLLSFTRDFQHAILASL